MPRDELKRPLQKRSFAQRVWQRKPSSLATCFAAMFMAYAAGGIWLMRQPLPFAGEPRLEQVVPALQKIESVAPSEPVADAALPTDDPANVATAATDQAPPPPSQKVTQLNKYVTIVTNSRPTLNKAPVSAITEDSPQGLLPKISDNGKKPSDVYSRSVSMNTLHSDAPKIVVILGGMGLNEKLTRQAISSLPSEITFAFAPYGNNLQAQVDKARDEGHEVLLQLPLEPVGYPANNPGPKTLLADADAETNLGSLYWHMSRFSGYAGVINYMGGRFLSTPRAIKSLLGELKKRGLNFMEDGSLPLSATDQVAGSMNMPVRHGNGVIDINSDPQSITASLNALEDQARNGEIAIGTGSGLESTINAVKDWARAAQARGIQIIPATAAFKGRSG